MHEVLPAVPLGLAFSCLLAAVPGSLAAPPFSMVLLAAFLTQVGALQTAPILIAVITAFLTMEGVKYLVARRKQAPAAAGKPPTPNWKISTKPGLNRYLRVTPGGLLRVDKSKIKTEAHLDGKYLLRCSDPRLSAADIALGYQQLLEVERGWRDMKQILDLRPVYHRLEERIRAHVLLCWLALLLIRVIETRTGRTWHHVRRDLDRLHAVTLTGLTGTFRQRTDPTKPQIDLYARLDLPLPKKIIEISTAEC